MITLLSPFAPLYPWLYDALNVMAPVHVVYGPLTDDAPVEVIDLRDLQTRAVILSAVATVGHSLPWALGGIWSPLTDEQAGRVVAEAIRRVGEDPGKPAGVVPIGVLLPWAHPTEDGICIDRKWMLPKGRNHKHYEYYTRTYLRRYGTNEAFGGWNVNLGKLRHFEPVIGQEGRDAADAYAFANGALLWEQVTP